MSNERTSLVQRLLKYGVAAALAVAVLAFPAAWLLATQTLTVQYIAATDEAVVEANRFLYEEEPSGADADIVAIYGTASGTPEEVLFVDESALIHPAENPNLALLRKGADENPLQVQTVWVLARFVTLGALAVFALGFLALVLLRRRSTAATGSAPVAA